MPIYREKRTVEVTCRHCGEKYTFTEGGYGDLPTNSLEQMLNFMRDIIRAEKGITCPKCGKKLSTSKGGNNEST